MPKRLAFWPVQTSDASYVSLTVLYPRFTVSREIRRMEANPSPVAHAARAMTIWVLTDGKIGDEIQCLAVARGLGGAFEKRVVAPRAPWVWMSALGAIDPRERRGVSQGPISGTPPDLIIASGRRVVPYAQAVKKASGGRTRIAFLKDPRAGRGAADVIWAPAHDRFSAPNAFSTLTSPHDLSARISERRASPGGAVAALPKPLLGVVLGGGGGYGAEEAAAFAARLDAAGADYASIAITPSRRTPPAFLQALSDQLRHARVYVWDRKSDNPYVDILSRSDGLIVGADSHNMVSEAVAAGVGVYAYRPPGLAKKLAWFVDQLEAQGAARPLGGPAPPFAHPPIDATPHIVAEIRKRLFAA